MGAARRNPQPPGNQIPADRSHQCAEYHRRVDNVRCNDSGPHRLGNVKSKEQECDEVEECGPDYRVLRSQHTSGNYGRNRIGSVMQPIQAIKDKGDQDQRDENERAERDIHSGTPFEFYTFSMTIALISFATSSNLSTTISR